MNRWLWKPVPMFFGGLLLGVISRLLDIYTQNLGNIFSETAVWILMGTLISIYSQTRKKAMVNVFLFCIGMLITYYVVAVISKGVYGWAFIIGWTIFACCTPVFAFFAWMSKENGLFAVIIRVGIVAVLLLSSVILFHGPHFYDIIIMIILAYFLFFKRVERSKILPE